MYDITVGTRDSCGIKQYVARLEQLDLCYECAPCIAAVTTAHGEVDTTELCAYCLRTTPSLDPDDLCIQCWAELHFAEGA